MQAMPLLSTKMQSRLNSAQGQVIQVWRKQQTNSRCQDLVSACVVCCSCKDTRAQGCRDEERHDRNCELPKPLQHQRQNLDEAYYRHAAVIYAAQNLQGTRSICSSYTLRSECKIMSHLPGTAFPEVLLRGFWQVFIGLNHY